MRMPKVTDRSSLTKKSQVTIPKKIRDALGVGPGDQVRFEVKKGKVMVLPVPSKLEENFGKVRPTTRPEDFKKLRKEFEEGVGAEVLKEGQK
jgi:AbrB family looped-hinge helix DNA binding protein